MALVPAMDTAPPSEIQFESSDCKGSKESGVRDDRPLNSLRAFRRGESYATVTSHGGDLAAHGFGLAHYTSAGRWGTSGSFELLDGHYVIGHRFMYSPAGFDRELQQWMPKTMDLLVLEHRAAPTWNMATDCSEKCEPLRPSVLSAFRIKRGGPPKIMKSSAALCGDWVRASGLDTTISRDGQPVVALGIQKGSPSTDDCKPTGDRLDTLLDDARESESWNELARGPLVAPRFLVMDDSEANSLPEPLGDVLGIVKIFSSTTLTASMESFELPNFTPAKIEIDGAHQGDPGIVLFSRDERGMLDALRKIRYVGVSVAQPNSSIVEFHDFDHDGHPDLFFSFDGQAWGIVPSILRTSGHLGVNCTDKVPKAGPFCISYPKGHSARDSAIRSYKDSTDVVFTMGSHTHGKSTDKGLERSPVDWSLVTLRWRRAEGWSSETLPLPHGLFYVAPTFAHSAPPDEGTDWLALSEIALDERESRVLFLPFGERRGARCTPAREGMFGGFIFRPNERPAVSPALDVAIPTKDSGPGDVVLVNLPMSPLAHIRSLRWGLCRDERQPAEPAPEFWIAPDDAAIAVRRREGETSLCVQFDKIVPERLDVANAAFKLHQYSFAVPP